MTSSRRARALVHLGVLVLLTAGLYGRTLAYGLVWDDYAALRTRPLRAVLGAWTGPWDPGGVWPDFYRPLSIAIYDAAFRLCGHNSLALHALTLIALLIAAWMLRAFVRRETASDTLGLVAAALLLLHPETPSSLAAWISQLFHLAALIAGLTAMLVWQRMRLQSGAGWGAVIAVLSLGVLIKEDVLMLAPTLLIWQVIRARIVGDMAAPSRTIVISIAGWAACYALWRTMALGAIGGYGWPSLARLPLNVISGPLFAFGLQWIPSAHGISAAAGAGVAVLAVLAWRSRHHAAPSLISLALCGLAMGIIANLPLMLISGHTRLYLLIVAAALTFTAALGIVAAAFTAARRAFPLTATLGVVLWAATLAAANWANTNTFAPCAPETLQRDAEVLSWEILPNDVRARLSAKVAACEPMTR